MLDGRLTKNINKKIVLEFLVSGIAQVLYIAQSVVQNKIFASFFAVEIFGQWSLLMSIYSLVSMLPFTAFDEGVNRLANDCKKQNIEKQFITLIFFVYGIGFLFYFLVFIMLNIVHFPEIFSNSYIFVFYLYTITEIIKNTLIIIDNAYRKRKKVLLFRAFGLTSRSILLIVLYYCFVFNIENVLWVLVATNIIILLFQIPYFGKMSFKGDKAIFKKLFLDILKFSWPLLAWAIFGWMQNMIGRWYLKYFLDESSVAMYSILTSLSYFAPSAIYSAMNAFVMPIVFEKNKTFTRKKLLTYLLFVGCFLFIYIIFVVFFGKIIIHVFADKKYDSILSYLPFTTISASLYVLSMLSTVEIYRRKQTKKLLLSTILPGLFMATGGFFLISSLGFNGAVINYIAGHLIYLVFTSFVVFNKKNINQEVL